MRSKLRDCINNHLQKSKGRKIDLRLWEIIVVDIDELTNKYPLSNHAVG